jgi:hypothetical protein
MEIIAHRRNTIAELRGTKREYGIEVDIRSEGERLIIHHEPLIGGEPFEDWINVYGHGTLILNVKEEGLEGSLIELMKTNGIEEYFFLDQSFPFLVKYSNLGERRCAVRISEFESIETALSLAGKVDWVWVDCFSRFPLNHADSQRLKLAGFKLCLVSPELQGRDASSEIPALASFLHEQEIQADAVCTKHPDIWVNLVD